MRLQILVPIHSYPEANTDGLARHAGAVARHLDADVHALVLAVEFPRVSSALGTMLVDVPAMVGDAKAKSQAHSAALVKALASETGQAGTAFRSSDVHCFPTAFGDAIATHARYHDLAVLGLGADESLTASAEAAVFGSGRPVLLVPEAAPASAFGHAMIAWDGSRVAARAVADALPFLRRAKTVTIASVTDEKALPDGNIGRRLADYLAKQDTNATVAQVKGGKRPIAQALQDHAREIGADVLVMGAFGHSRVRDFVLGGATTGILKELKMPALLSH